MGPDINAREALYGFMAWLTTRPEPVTLSSRHEAGVAADLVEQWAKANHLPGIREDKYPNNIVHP